MSKFTELTRKLNEAQASGSSDSLEPICIEADEASEAGELLESEWRNLIDRSARIQDSMNDRLSCE